MPDVYLRFGYRDEDSGDVKWNVSHDWKAMPYAAFTQIQKIMHAAEGEVLKMADAKIAAGGNAGSSLQPNPGMVKKP